MESSNQLTRWVNIILKPSISLKNLKKLKVEEFVKAITTVLQEKETFNYFVALSLFSTWNTSRTVRKKCRPSPTS
jgi:menaquinone-dependent protoporphyrinogen IX oxidase